MMLIYFDKITFVWTSVISSSAGTAEAIRIWEGTEDLVVGG